MLEHYGNQPESQETPTCLYYQNGYCRNGNHCRFAHKNTIRMKDQKTDEEKAKEEKERERQIRKEKEKKKELEQKEKERQKRKEEEVKKKQEEQKQQEKQKKPRGKKKRRKWSKFWCWCRSRKNNYTHNTRGWRIFRKKDNQGFQGTSTGTESNLDSRDNEEPKRVQ